MGTGLEVLTDMPARLTAARTDVADCRQALAVALERRNQLAVTAVDEGMNQNRVAELIGVKPPHMIRVLSNSDGGE